MTEQDVHNYSSSPLHRLPTYSASQALAKLSSLPQQPLPSGVRKLDLLLQGNGSQAEGKNDLPAGFSRRETTEIFGPPGVGKTTIALQLTANELKEERPAAWVDTASRFSPSRLKDIAAAATKSQESTTTAEPQSSQDPIKWSNLHHFQCPTLPHLLALLAHPSDSLPSDLSLLVIDNLSTLFNLAYPKRYESNSSSTDGGAANAGPKKRDSAQWASGRRWAVLSDLVSRLNRLAATNNIAIVLLNQTATRVRQGGGAHLYPAISGSIWENGIANRVVLYRDWLARPNEQDGWPYPRHTGSIRFAGILKAKGVGYEGAGMTALFKIDKGGLKEVETVPSSERNLPNPVVKLKRKWDEIADSSQSGAEVQDNVAGSEEEEDEYGWQKDDETAEADELLGSLP